MRYRLALLVPLLMLAACGATRARPLSPLASLISPDDYPAAEHAGEGRVAVILDIGPDGRVAACRVRRSSGSSALDGATCRILRARARYAPARDRRGAAIAGHDRVAVIWRLPED